jgi:ABC-type nitrate/sulfonate/bicarbonate transport system substrate-binding protein
MLSLVLALAAGAAMQGDGVNAARDAYSTCLREFLRAQLEANAEPAAFEAALSSQCGDRGNAFQAAIVARDGRNASTRAAAEEDARMTMGDIRANMVERYRDEYSMAHPAPAPQAAPAPAPATPTEPAPATPQ